LQQCERQKNALEIFRAIGIPFGCEENLRGYARPQRKISKIIDLLNSWAGSCAA
jgi:hypothetical protein